MTLADRLNSHDWLDGNYFKMADGITPTTEFPNDGESRAQAPTDGVETK
jgi:hypothetical protein